MLMAAKDVFFELWWYAPRLEQAYNFRKRETVKKAISLKGSEEYRLPENPKVGTPLGGIAVGIVKAFDKIVDHKINYTQKLLDLVHDHDVNEFYNDLQHGLDYTLSKWDKSAVNAKEWGYLVDPKKALRTYRYVAKKDPFYMNDSLLLGFGIGESGEDE